MKPNKPKRDSLLALRTKALKMAMMIIRNDAFNMGFNSHKEFNDRMRWLEELEVEAGLRKDSSK